MKRKDGFAPIGAYAAIGDGSTTALVALDGSIDFLSLPAMHYPTTFAALLDPDKGGRFALAPTGAFDAQRRYVERTNVLETTYTTKDGVVRVTEALNLQGGGLLPWRELARRVECLSGEVELEWRVEARPDFGRADVQLDRRRGVPVFEGGGVEVAVHAWDAGEPELSDGAVAATFTLRDGERALLALGSTHEEPIPIPSRDDVERRLRETIDVWRTWLGTWSYDGPWEEQVARSALTLKLLVHEPNGAIVAAPTTSLPEQIGSDRNYDYRYMWVRDAAFTIDALMRLGLPEQVHESFCCLLRAVRTTRPDLRPFYSVDGHPAQRCDELPLRGYRDSRPVRYGNAASSQLQIGSWGDLLETASLYLETGNALDDETASLLQDCVDRLSVIWHDDDSGIWELQEQRSYTSSNFSAWMALDRAVTMADDGHLPGTHAARWRDERARAVAYIEEECWSDELGTYVEYAGGDTLDAAVVRAARMGWYRVSGERLRATTTAVRERLDAGGGLLWRRTGNVGEEGAFLACSFWMVESLVHGGDVDAGAELFEQLLGYANDVGLLAEEVDPDSGELRGNFPQGLSHLSLINAASAIERARDAGTPAREGAAAR
ncbi:MAG TPA: glycoside hydrolase family 15 protein [Gaiellaceae bacterium]|nr:glycoside hydrolase family 15 protein [Gaiellaceae bacterium]